MVLCLFGYFEEACLGSQIPSSVLETDRKHLLGEVVPALFSSVQMVPVVRCCEVNHTATSLLITGTSRPCQRHPRELVKLKGDFRMKITAVEHSE